VCDQPVASVIGRRNTASENIAPIAMHVMNAPSADHHPAVARFFR
jgi:hypothetical protein